MQCSRPSPETPPHSTPVANLRTTQAHKARGQAGETSAQGAPPKRRAADTTRQRLPTPGSRRGTYSRLPGNPRSQRPPQQLPSGETAMHAIRTTPRRSPWPWIVGAAALMG